MNNAVGIIPHFKGDVPPIFGREKRRRNETVMTGKDPATGLEVSEEVYLQLLACVHGEQRQVAENVARVFAAGLYGYERRLLGDDVQPFFLEGCRWDWGEKERYGAEISRDIYSIMPEQIRGLLHEPVVNALTKRTRDEFEHALLLSDARGLDAVTTITHPYHRFRTELIGDHMKRIGGYRQQLAVHTPGEIADMRERSNRVQPYECFMIDAIRVCEPSVQTCLKEGIREKGPLLALHLAERLTGKDWERKILERMAVRNGREK